MDDKKVNCIADELPWEELLCQLAEEASELAQAALKLRRASDNTNPTTVSLDDALASLVEEVADVALCLYVLGINDIYNTGRDQMNYKLNRWCERLKERKNET